MSAMSATKKLVEGATAASSKDFVFAISRGGCFQWRSNEADGDSGTEIEDRCAGNKEEAEIQRAGGNTFVEEKSSPEVRVIGKKA